MLKLDGLFVDVLHTETSHMLSKVHGAEGRQKDVDWLFKFNLWIYFVLSRVQFAHLHKYLQTVLLRHLKVEEHEVNRPNHIALTSL